MAFGVFSLPAGWLADRWSRRNMMAAFYIGCGLSLAGAGFAPDLTALAVVPERAVLGPILGHLVSFRARRSSSSSASSRCVQKEPKRASTSSSSARGVGSSE